MYKQIRVEREVFGNGENLLTCGSVLNLPEEMQALKGKVQCVYVDPPFMTGEKFTRRRPFGETGWKKGAPVCSFSAYEDRYTNEQIYLALLRWIIVEGWELLRETGVFYLHLDWRMSAESKLICDEVFGREGFMNEIIWSYESGGRSKRTFSRKHDTILLYAKNSKKVFFDIERTPLPRGETRRNHMARGMDEQGRMYSKIVTGGKEYRYYDDEPVYPGDVWTDISHLQQRDPERSGYATQKPLKLLERLLLPVTLPGDLVTDLCCGSGTSLVAAQKLGCRFAGLDLNPEAVAVTLSRLKAENLTVICPDTPEPAVLQASAEEGRFNLLGFNAEHPAFPDQPGPLDALESWETGRIEHGVFFAEQAFRRSFAYPQLTDSLRSVQAPEAIMTTDAAGRRRAFLRQE